MNRMIITEEEKNEILMKYIINEGEEYINRTNDKSYDYKFLDGKYYYSKKNQNKWILSKPGSNGEASIKKNVIFNPLTTSVGCQAITSKSDIKDLPQIIDSISKMYGNADPYKIINGLLNKYSKLYVKEGIPQRIRCELALLKIRPGYKDKNVFILDSALKLLYLYDKNGEFISKTDVITGKNKQSDDPKKIAQALMNWEEVVNSLGFKWVTGKGYVDTTDKNRKFNDKLVYSSSEKNKTRFLPKGIYTTDTELTSGGDEYAGGKDNALFLKNDNKKLFQAIHGYYIEQPRTEALMKAREVISKPNDPKISKEFMDLVLQGKADMSQSFGCINVPTWFLKYLREYGADSYVFNMGEDKENYLANNTEDYFNKMINSQSCPSPKSLGATPISDEQSFA